MSDLGLTIEARTDTGRQRAANEDAFVVLDAAQLGLAVEAAFVVADGMGGMKAGDVASQEAVRVVQETLAQQLVTPERDPQSALAEAFTRANAAVYSLAREAVRAGGGGEDAPTEAREGQPGAADAQPGLMGTTCVAGVIKDGALNLAHVGDSRAYLLRGGELLRLTRDHSFVEERVRAGDLTEEQARRSRFRNMITRAIGIEAQVEPEVRHEPLQPGDMLLLCTDGLTTMLEDGEIADALRRGGDLDRAAGALIDAANRKGGADNITVLLARAEAAADEPDTVRMPIHGASRGTRPARRGASPAAATPPPVETASAVPSRPISAAEADVPALPPSRPRRRASPLIGLLAWIGALALGLTGALAVSRDLRSGVARRLAPPPAAPPLPTIPDLARVSYEKPVPLSPLLARGDLLVYSPRDLLYAVADTSGKVVSLSLTGETGDVVAQIPVAPPLAAPIPVTHMFVTTDAQGNAYISSTAQRTIKKYDPRGRLLNTMKGFERPEAVAVDGDGNLYVVDANRIKVLRARAAGAVRAAPAAGTMGP